MKYVLCKFRFGANIVILLSQDKVAITSYSTDLIECCDLKKNTYLNVKYIN